MRLLRHSRGDTMVEVLIAIAVMSFTLSGAYVVANRSSQATRQSQERSEALKVAESQLEGLKAYLATPGSVDPSSKFCLYYAGTPSTLKVKIDGLEDIYTTNPSLLGDQFPGECKTGTDNRYNTAIVRPYPSSDPNLYSVKLRWEQVKGGGIDEISMFYRLYKPGEGSSASSPLPSPETPRPGPVPTPPGTPRPGPVPTPPGRPPVLVPPGFNVLVYGNEYRCPLGINPLLCKNDDSRRSVIHHQTGHSPIYNIAGRGISPGSATITISYKNHRGFANNLPYPPDYEPRVKIDFDGQGVQVLTLDRFRSSVSFQLDRFTITIPNAPSNIRIEWLNDYATGPYDANFELGSIRLVKRP